MSKPKEGSRTKAAAMPQARKRPKNRPGSPTACHAEAQHPLSAKPKGHKAPWLKQYAFRKGQSGCPGGKRKGAVSLSAQLKARLSHEDACAIVARLIGLAKAGDLAAVKLLLDRIDGPQSGPLAVAMAGASQTVHSSELDDAFEGWTPEQLRNILGALEVNGASIRAAEAPKICTAAEYLLQDGPAKPRDALPARAETSPGPTPPAPEPPARLAPAERPVKPTPPPPSTLSESEVMGSEAERTEEERIRQSDPPPRSRSMARRAARALWG